jgi:hypothetical protein
MGTRFLGRVGRLLAVAGLMLVVFAPIAASAQTDYPTTPTTTPPSTSPLVVTAPPHVSTGSTGTSGVLAFTGGNIALLVGLGLVAAGGGFVLIRVGRHRTATQ